MYKNPNYEESFFTSNILEDTSPGGITGSNVTTQEYLMNLLNQMSKKATVPVNSYKEIVRFLLNEFNDICYISEELEAIPVKCRYGSPERTVAKLKEEDNMILPLMTISQNMITEDDARRKFYPVVMQSSYFNEETQRAERIISLCDRPVTLQYNLNVWSKYMEDMDQLAQQIRLKFNPSIELYTKFSKDSKAFLLSETNNFALSVGDREDRIIKKSFSIGIETYIRSPKYKVTSSGKIEELNLETKIK